MASIGSVQRMMSPGRAVGGALASTPSTAKCFGPMSKLTRAFAPSTHVCESSTMSSFFCPASDRETSYGDPTYVMFVFGTTCGL